MLRLLIITGLNHVNKEDGKMKKDKNGFCLRCGSKPCMCVDKRCPYCGTFVEDGIIHYPCSIFLGMRNDESKEIAEEKVS